MKKNKEIPGNIAALHNKSAATREHLLDTAEALFIQKGFDATSLKQVAENAGVTKGHLYYYYKTKQELFDAVLERYFRSYIKAFDFAIKGEKDVRARLHAAIDAYLDLIGANPDYPRLVQREVCSDSPNIKQIALGLEPLYEWMKTFLKDVLPETGPGSMRHFFISFIGIAVNYFTYSPVLEYMWDFDPMEDEAVSERREHVHMLLDAVMDRFLKPGKKSPKRKRATRSK